MDKVPLHRSLRFRKIAGVCAGIAETTNIPTLYIRAMFFITFFYGSLAFWVYLLLWILLPVMESDNYQVHEKELFRSRFNRMIGGVCTGLANATSTDPVIVRLVFIALAVFGGSGLFLYLVMWLILPEEH